MGWGGFQGSLTCDIHTRIGQRGDVLENCDALHVWHSVLRLRSSIKWGKQTSPIAVVMSRAEESKHSSSSGASGLSDETLTGANVES